MYDPYINFYIGLVITLFSIVTGICKWRYTDTAGKLFLVNMVWYLYINTLLMFCFFYPAIRIHLQGLAQASDTIAPIVDYATLMLFYNYSIGYFKKYRVGFYLILIGVLSWMATALLFHDTQNFNVYFIPFTCMANIVLSVLLLFYIQRDAEFGKLTKRPVFWFAILLLFYWGVSFFWSLIFDLLMKTKEARQLSGFIIARVTDVYYLGAGLTYFLYRNKKLSS